MSYFCGVTKMYKLISVKQDVYQRLDKLRQELGLLNMNDVVDLISKAYLSYSLTKRLYNIFQRLDVIKQQLAMLYKEETNIKPPARRDEKVAKGAQKADLSSFMKK
jgi:hypothetical protein